MLSTFVRACLSEGSQLNEGASLNNKSSVNGECSFKETASVEKKFKPNDAALLREGPS